jgi:iron complex transport system ATP-binding protein
MLLGIQNLAGGYRTAAVIQEVNLTLQSLGWLSLVGANGSGRSTLLRIMSQMLRPVQGVVFLDGEAVHRQPPHRVARNLLPHQQRIPVGLTVRQFVSLGRSPHSPVDRQKIRAVMADMQIEDLGDRPIEQLSDDRRQRAFLALALAQDPKLLLLDEPTTHLDIRSQLHLLELLQRLNRQGLAIITALHDINLAARYSDRIALLDQSQVWAIGSPAQVLTPANLAQVLGVKVAVSKTPRGLQLYPLTPCAARTS